MSLRQGEESLSSPAAEETTMSEQKFPPGWDEARVREVLAHYENQTEDGQFAEIEAAQEAEGITMMAVPTELVSGSSCFAGPKEECLSQTVNRRRPQVQTVRTPVRRLKAFQRLRVLGA